MTRSEITLVRRRGGDTEPAMRSPSRPLIAIALAAFVTAGCMRETQVASPARPQVVEPSRGRVPAGTTMWVQLDHSVGGKHARVGDIFTARVTQDVLSPQGEVLIPAGARVQGRVVYLEKSGHVGEAAKIGLDPRSVRFAGETQRLEASIVDSEVHHKGAKVKGTHVAIGAAAGAILGGLVHGWTGALVGGAIGAGAGTLISLGTSDVRAELPAGTRLAIQLDRPVKSVALLRGRRVY